jgi:hypothetical protein
MYTKSSEILSDDEEGGMDGFSIALGIALCLGGLLYVGAVMLWRTRSRRERLQMKRHVQTIEVEVADRDEAALSTHTATNAIRPHYLPPATETFSKRVPLRS